MKLDAVELKIDVSYGGYSYNYRESVDWTKGGLEIEADDYAETLGIRKPKHGTILLEYRSIPKQGVSGANFKLWVSNAVLVHFNEKACFLKFGEYLSGDWAGYVRFIRAQEHTIELIKELNLISAFLVGDMVPYVESRNEWPRANLRVPKNYLDLTLEDLQTVRDFRVEQERRRLSIGVKRTSKRETLAAFKI